MSVAYGDQNSGYQIVTNNGTINHSTWSGLSPDAADNECLSTLLSAYPVVSDPYDQLKHIEHMKGGLLKDSYEWILNHPSYLQVQNDAQKQLLWIKGDPGHGKTMLLIGIIKELQQSDKQPRIAYSFCQGTNAPMNTPTAVLRGLIYCLIQNQPKLVAHLRERYDRQKSIFEDGCSFFALSDVATRMLRDPGLGKTYIVIDALDECQVNQDQLLSFITQNMSASPSVKWILSSRKIPAITDHLGRFEVEAQMHLDLTDNPEAVSTAVGHYIDHKVANLQALRYDEDKRKEVQKTIHDKADHTFLWAALVIREIETANEWEVLSVLDSMPSGLEGLYHRMMDQINDLRWKNPEFCHRILATATLAYRPLALAEIAVLADLPTEISSAARNIRKLVTMCGSFLRVQGNSVEFIHQSAKDFLSDTMNTAIFNMPYSITHFSLFTRSTKVMSNGLKKNIYQLECPGTLTEEIQVPDPDPLSKLRYSCIYWIDHLFEENEDGPNAMNTLRDNGEVHAFLSEHLLHWLEALSLTRAMSNGISIVGRLQSWMKNLVGKSAFLDLLQDVYRFLLAHGSVIQMAPLQVYASALLFSPSNSLTRNLFIHEKPAWILEAPLVDEDWSPIIQTLEGDTEFIKLAFSPDSRVLAAMDEDGSISIWDVHTGLLRSKLKAASRYPGEGEGFLAFSHDSKVLASIHQRENQISVWDVMSGSERHTIIGCQDELTELFFTQDFEILFAAGTENLQIWETDSWSLIQPIPNFYKDLQLGSQEMPLISFCPSSGLLALCSRTDIQVWDMIAASLRTTVSLNQYISSIAFSHDSHILLCGTFEGDVLFISTASWSIDRTLGRDKCSVDSVRLSHDSRLLISIERRGGTPDTKIWNTRDRTVLKTMRDTRIIEFSPSSDSHLLAAVQEFESHVICVWDVEMILKGDIFDKRGPNDFNLYTRPERRLLSRNHFCRFSADLELVASWPFWYESTNMTISRISTGAIEKKLNFFYSMNLVLSHDLGLFASLSPLNHDLAIVETSSACIKHQIPNVGAPQVLMGYFSHDKRIFAFVQSATNSIGIVDLITGELTKKTCGLPVEGTGKHYEAVFVSRDSELVGLRRPDAIVIWKSRQVSEAQFVMKPSDLEGYFQDATISHDSTLMAAVYCLTPSNNIGNLFTPESLLFIWKTETLGVDGPVATIKLQGICGQLLDFNFEPTNAWLNTGAGCLSILTETLTGTDQETEPRNFLHEGKYIGFRMTSVSDYSWAEINGRRVLFIPFNYRPAVHLRDKSSPSRHQVREICSTQPSTVDVTTIVVRDRSGRIWRMKLSEDVLQPPLAEKPILPVLVVPGKKRPRSNT